ncbi:MAG: GPP34 family phosphoprotein [Eubacteriaceae bacterium]|nr:GPP34 family phosphoprotein [Eubacteriaceae bacterium]
MDPSSYALNYFLCALDYKGSISTPESRVAFVAGAVSELVHYGYLENAGNGQLLAGKPWDGGLPYLEPLYMAISSMDEPLTLHGIVLGLDIYCVDELLGCAGDFLISTGQLCEKQGDAYFPKEGIVASIIERTRSALTGGGDLADEGCCLAALLAGDGSIKAYLGDADAAIALSRIKELASTNNAIGAINWFIEAAALIMRNGG